MYPTRKEDYFEEFFADTASLLEDLGQSGFHTVHDATLQELAERGKTAAQCGMEYLSELLLSLQEELSQNRHKIYPTNTDHQNFSPQDDGPDSLSAKYYTELVRYIDLGREKTAYDRGKNYYLNSKKEDGSPL